MRCPRFSLRTKLILSFLGVIVLGGLLSLVVGSRLIRDTLLSQAQAKVRHDLSSAWMVFNEKLDDIRDVVRLTAVPGEPAGCSSRTGRKDILLRYLSRVRTENGLDILTLVDRKGRVLLRTRSPETRRATTNPGTNSSAWRSSGRSSPAPRSSPGRSSSRKSEALAEQALIDFIPTPMAAPRAGNAGDERDDAQGRRPDHRTRTARCSAPWTEGFCSTGTTRSSTGSRTSSSRENSTRAGRRGRRPSSKTTSASRRTSRTSAGERAIGTRVSEEVKKAVLDEGQPWLARAFVVNDWYLTAYEPIRNIEGRIIGILYVGMLEKPYLDTADRVMLTFTLIAALCVLFLLALLLFFDHPDRPPSPADGRRRRRQIAKGDLSHKVEVNSRDEIGELADSFNQMTAISGRPTRS